MGGPREATGLAQKTPLPLRHTVVPSQKTPLEAPRSELLGNQRASSRLARQNLTQEVARAYDAQCTPDFFGFSAQDERQYRGRLDASRIQPAANVRRDLFESMKQVAETGHGPVEQMRSMGCSIKWKNN